MLKSRSLALVGLVVIVGSASAQKKGTPTLDKSFDATMDSVLKAWKVPGIGLAVVKGDKVIYMKGYGYRDLEQKVPVTPNTKFAIGSVTKSFTVTALASQAGQGLIDWDVPVRKYTPSFEMHDPVATQKMTLRDLVTHRSGLPRHDATWGAGGLTREQLFHAIKYLEPNKEFRSYWQYQNLMFLAAGYASGKVENKSWEEVVRARVFQPLDMTTADFSVNDLQRSADFSYGYSRLPNDSVVRTPYQNIDDIGPAGSINASPEEMTHYLIMHMNGGRYQGKQVIPADQCREMQSPQMVMPSSRGPTAGGAEVGEQQYGLGVMVGTYRGRKVVHHGGNIAGFSAEISWLPNDSIGVVVLTNMSGTATRDFIPFIVYDRLLGLSPIDWSGRYMQQYLRGRARADSARARDVASRVTGTKPSHELTAYTGTYNHPGYGDINVTLEGGTLKFSYGRVSYPLEHWHYDVFETKSNTPGAPGRWKAQFHMDMKGAITSLSVPIEPAVGETVFKKKVNP